MTDVPVSQEAREVTQADILRQLDRAIERIMGVEIEAMGGDNLAVLLCSHFEDADDDSEPDDNGWRQSALDAYEEIREEIMGLFVPVREAISALARHRQQAERDVIARMEVVGWMYAREGSSAHVSLARVTSTRDAFWGWTETPLYALPTPPEAA